MILALLILGTSLANGHTGNTYNHYDDHYSNRPVSVITDMDAMVEVALTPRYLIVTPIRQARYRNTRGHSSVSLNIPGPGFEVIIRKDKSRQPVMRKVESRYYPIESIRNIRHHRGELVIVHQHGRRTFQEYVRLEDGPRAYPLEFNKRDVKRFSNDLKRMKRQRR